MSISLPPQVQGSVGKLFEAIPLNLPGGIAFNYIQAILIVVLLFLLIYTFGHLRHTYVGWSIKGIAPGFAFGFVVAILLEGLFLIGGKTLFTQVLGWKTAPKPISNVLDASREKIVDVLGAENQIPTSNASEPQTVEEIISTVKTMDENEQNKVNELLCSPN